MLTSLVIQLCVLYNHFMIKIFFAADLLKGGLLASDASPHWGGGRKTSYCRSCSYAVYIYNNIIIIIICAVRS